MEAFVNKRTKLFQILISIALFLIFPSSLFANPPLGVFIKSRIEEEHTRILKLGNLLYLIETVKLSNPDYPLPTHIKISFNHATPKALKLDKNQELFQENHHKLYAFSSHFTNITFDEKTNLDLYFDQDRVLMLTNNFESCNYLFKPLSLYEIKELATKDKIHLTAILQAELSCIQRNTKSAPSLPESTALQSPLIQEIWAESMKKLQEYIEQRSMLSVLQLGPPKLKKNLVQLLPFTATINDQRILKNSFVLYQPSQLIIVNHLKMDKKTKQAQLELQAGLSKIKEAGLQNQMISFPFDQRQAISLDQYQQALRHNFQETSNPITEAEIESKEELAPIKQSLQPSKQPEADKTMTDKLQSHLIPLTKPPKPQKPQEPIFPYLQHPNALLTLLSSLSTLLALVILLLLVQIAQQKKQNQPKLEQRLSINQKKPNPQNLIDWVPMNPQHSTPMLEVFHAISQQPIRQLTIQHGALSIQISLPITLKDLAAQGLNPNQSIQLITDEYQPQTLESPNSLLKAQKTLRLYLYPYQALLSLKYQRLFQKINLLSPQSPIIFSQDLIESIKARLTQTPIQPEQALLLSEHLEEVLFDQQAHISDQLYRKLNPILEQAIQEYTPQLEKEKAKEEVKALVKHV